MCQRSDPDRHRRSIIAQAFITRGLTLTLGQTSPSFRDALWARRAEWLPAEVARAAPVDAADAMARVQERMTFVADPEVIDFIKRARAARPGTTSS